MTQADRDLAEEVRFNSGVADMAIYTWMSNNNMPQPGENESSCPCPSK